MGSPDYTRAVADACAAMEAFFTAVGRSLDMGGLCDAASRLNDALDGSEAVRACVAAQRGRERARERSRRNNEARRRKR